MAASSQGPLEAMGGQGVGRCRHHLALSVAHSLWVCFLSCQEPGIRTPKERGRNAYIILETQQELEVLTLERKYSREMKPKGDRSGLCFYSCRLGLRTRLSCGFRRALRFPTDVRIIWKPGYVTAGYPFEFYSEWTVVDTTCQHCDGCGLRYLLSGR